MQIMLDMARIGLTLFFLFYASWSDYKTREVGNSVWIFFAPSAFALTFAELLLYEPSQLLFFGFSFGLTAVIAILLFYSGGFGGADAKALMCIALALPFYPENSFSTILGRPSPISKIFFPLTVFSNSVILVIVPVLWIVSRNIFWRSKTGRKLFEGNQGSESVGKKILVLITGYKVSINKLKEKWHVYPLEDIEENAEGSFRRKLVVLPKDEGRDDVVNRLEKAISRGTIEDGIWASPGLPMLILITLGLVVALFLGDIVWTLVTTMLG
jgi:preflagellin peptidase FlaK